MVGDAGCHFVPGNRKSTEGRDAAGEAAVRGTSAEARKLQIYVDISTLNIKLSFQEETSRPGGNVSPNCDVIVVGAGFAGLYSLYRLRAEGYSIRVFEAGDGVGGTWYWNRYPGARCDIESLQYSYSFSEEVQQEWEWSELYAGQPEILAYINHVADRFDLKRDITFNSRVVSADFIDDRHVWRVETDAGEVVEARFVVMATGNLSIPISPDLPGLETFGGEVYASHNWPKDKVNFSGRSVALFGTGASGVQITPLVAADAKHLTVFQRTPNYSIPLQNKPMDPDYQADWKANYRARRQEALKTRNNALMHHTGNLGADLDIKDLNAVFEDRWSIGGITFVYGFADTAISPHVNEAASEFVRTKIRSKVNDTQVAEKLLPNDHPLGSKRLCADTRYYEAFNRENVTLVDLRQDQLETIEKNGIRTSSGFHPVDTIVLATGFDAMTGALRRINPRGRGGIWLCDKWGEDPRTLLGTAIAGFPNLFVITGPGSPSVFSNFVTSIEQNVDWIADCLRYLKTHEIVEIEAEATAEAEWFEHVNAVAARTLLPNARSWYVGANISGKPRYFMAYLGGVPAYRQALDRCASEGYRGFKLTSGK